MNWQRLLDSAYRMVALLVFLSLCSFASGLVAIWLSLQWRYTFDFPGTIAAAVLFSTIAYLAHSILQPHLKEE